jgi:hypothetical protein
MHDFSDVVSQAKMMMIMISAQILEGPKVTQTLTIWSFGFGILMDMLSFLQALGEITLKIGNTIPSFKELRS